MTLQELISRCRRQAEDTAQPQFWSDEQWADALNEAEDEACIRARLIEDDALTADATALDAYIALPPRAFSVRQVSIDGKSLELLSRDELFACLDGALEDEAGFPAACYRVGNQLRLYPIPQDDAVVKLAAFCTPKSPMELGEAGTITPEIPGRMHIKLVDWALAIFFGVPDVDYTNNYLANLHEARFGATFGPRPDEVEMRRTALRTRRPSRCLFF